MKKIKYLIHIPLNPPSPALQFTAQSAANYY